MAAAGNLLHLSTCHSAIAYFLPKLGELVYATDTAVSHGRIRSMNEQQETPTSAISPIYELQSLLATHYNLQELRTLALRFNLDLEDVGGETRADKARELTLLFARQNRLPALLAALQEERPHVNWPHPTQVVVPVAEKRTLSHWLRENIWTIGGVTVVLLLGITAVWWLNGRDSDPAWHSISGGTAILGTTSEFCTLPVQPFQIQRTEVRNQDYLNCVQAGNCAPPPLWQIGENGWTHPAGEASHPVWGISWTDAAAYCESIGARLPEEAEWVFASRGNRTANYPWGDAFDGDLGNLAESGNGRDLAVSVSADRCQDQPVCDLIGNVREWVQDTAVNACYTGDGSGQHISKGGSFADSAATITLWTRMQSDEQPYVGVRCVRDQ